MRVGESYPGPRRAEPPTRLRSRECVLEPAWIVDGMNVIGSRPNGWWRDRPAAMRALVGRLERFAAAEDVAVTVIFDGRPVPVDAGRVQVVFASRSGQNAADDDIAALVAGSPKPGALRVVTSDATLKGRVEAAGGEVEGAGAFLRRLDDAAP
jgi:predicted RNA-binding protein with PIN domain